MQERSTREFISFGMPDAKLLKLEVYHSLKIVYCRDASELEVLQNINRMGMEDDARSLLVKVSKSLGTGLIWLIINMTFGIYFGWLFFGEHMTVGNYIFYAFMIVTLALLIWYQIRVWK